MHTVFRRTQAVRIAAHLRAHDNILVAAHANPDGDALGSSSAAGWILQALGKRFALYNASGLPSAYVWLQAPGPFYDRLDSLPFAPELVLCLDCGDAQRLGPELAQCLDSMTSINIDHHLGNPHFASLENWVEPEMAATGQLVAEVARAADLPLHGAMAEGIALALVSDTGSFSFGGISADLFHLMAELVAGGLELGLLCERMNKNWTASKSRLWGLLLSRLAPQLDNRLLLVTISQADMAACQSTAEDLEGFVELLRRHKTVEIAALLREETPTRCKLSLRSFGETDVRKIALRFGGGGHKNAAGAHMRQPLHEARASVLAVTGEHLGA